MKAVPLGSQNTVEVTLSLPFLQHNHLVLPSNVIIGPNWLLLVIEGVFVIPLLIDILTPWDLSHTARRLLVLVPLSLSTLALAVGVALFVSTLATNTNANNLLRAGALLWVFNILVFA